MKHNNTIQRFFDKTLKQERKEITLYKTGETMQCFFRRNSDGNDALSRVTLFYKKDAPLKKGDLFIFNNQIFLTINQETPENEVYYRSVAFGMDAMLKTTYNNFIYYVPVVAGKLQGFMPSRNVGDLTISTAGGYLEAMTEDNEFSRSIKADDSFSVFGGTYKCVNYYYRSGIAYIYLDRTLDNPSETNTYTFGINANDKYTIGTTGTIPVIAKENDAQLLNPTVTWTSGDMTKAVVNSDGTISFSATGTVTLTATWVEQNLTDTVTIEIIEDVLIPYTSAITYSGSQAVLKIGGSPRTYTAHFYNSSLEEVALTPVWTITYPQGYESYFTDTRNADGTITITPPSTLTSDTSKLVGTIVKVSLNNELGNAPSSMNVTVTTL